MRTLSASFQSTSIQAKAWQLKFISSFALVLSLRRGHTLSRSSSPKMGPLTLDQTLFVVVLLLYHSKKTQIFRIPKTFRTFKIFETPFKKKKVYSNTQIFKYLSQPHSSKFGVRVINCNAIH